MLNKWNIIPLTDNRDLNHGDRGECFKDGLESKYFTNIDMTGFVDYLQNAEFFRKTGIRNKSKILGQSIHKNVLAINGDIKEDRRSILYWDCKKTGSLVLDSCGDSHHISKWKVKKIAGCMNLKCRE